MINKTPTNLDKFPVPVSGQKIPGGWFARLVSFINSLVLHGDGQYLTVKHTQAGQTIAPTPALLQALGQRGAPPAAGGGGAIGFLDPSAAAAHYIVDGSTYTTLSDGILVATAAVTIPAGIQGAGWGWIELAKNSQTIRIDFMTFSCDQRNGSGASSLVSISVPVAAGVTIKPLWGANSSSETVTCYGTFYT